MDIQPIKARIEEDNAQINSLQALEAFRLKYLGRRGELAQLTAAIPGLAPEERSRAGQEINALKQKLLEIIAEKQNALAVVGQGAVARKVDITMPGLAQELGRLHPVTQVINEICGIFTGMGFCVVEGPEIETEFNNFTGLNIPLEHPSRDAFDTFYVAEPRGTLRRTTHNVACGVPRMVPRSSAFLLRSHTSPVQVRVMRSRKPPLAVVVPGRVYRPDATDASHLFMFHQIEGFMVDRDIKFSDLKGVLELVVKRIFGSQAKARFRPHFFPFTEPSAEVDVSCAICKGNGCPSCGRKGWLEILGCGMIHPNVFKQVGYDPKQYTGFAFGMGVERIASLKFGINDIRMFYENDLRFLRQF
jgi:phenylalanyl-tRNA synthetase alpha chain